MRYLWGQGRVVKADNEDEGICEGVVLLGSAEGAGFRVRAEMLGGKMSGGEGPEIREGKGVVDVGAGFIWCLIRSGTVFGDTFSTIVKEGKRRIVVGSEGEWCSCGAGMLEADSISFYGCHVIRRRSEIFGWGYLHRCWVQLHNL